MILNSFVAALLTLAVASADSTYTVPSLTPNNYEELTDGKTVFIKFFAPWVSESLLSCAQHTALQLLR